MCGGACLAPVSDEWRQGLDAESDASMYLATKNFQRGETIRELELGIRNTLYQFVSERGNDCERWAQD